MREVPMLLASTLVSALLAALLAYSAIRKLSHDPPVVQGYATAGVPESWLNTLAWILLAGAAALMIGRWWPPLGVAVAGALLVYFGVAISFHLRAGDAEHLPVPASMAFLAAAALAFRIATL